MTDKIPRPEDYDVSHKYGFLLPDCLVELPDYFSPWNILAKALPNLIENKTVREAVKQLPELDHCKLTDSRQQRCAHLFLSLISSAYVWQEGDMGVAEILPRQLAVPLSGISERLGFPPIVCHSSIVLANWTLSDPEGPLELSNMRTIIGLHPRSGFDWFVIVTLWVEIQFATAIKDILEAMNAVKSKNTGLLKDCLQKLNAVLVNMKEAFVPLHDKLDGNTFYNHIRPFLPGYGGPSSPLPNGLIYEGVSDEPKQLIGSSAAQSGILQSFDALLGIQHEPDKEDFLKTMRTYMPLKHAAFVEAIRNGSSLKKYVVSSNNPILVENYNEVITALEELRSYHIKVVTKYIICPSHSIKDNNYKSISEKGTGGTTIIPFLKSLRDTTKDHLQ